MSTCFEKTKIFFITGTDTGVGKTTITCALLDCCRQQGLSAIGLKPVAAGCDQVDGQWQNRDAQLLQQHSSVALDSFVLKYEEVNPVALEPAIAPHIAAQHVNSHLDGKSLARHCQQVIAQHQPHVCFIEGAGGWLVPLNDCETMADIAVAMQTSVILVVGVKLGCLNHSLLTVNAIQQSGLKVAGWVGNCIDPEAEVVEENIATLKQRIDAPCLGTLPFFKSIDSTQVAERLTTDQLMDY